MHLAESRLSVRESSYGKRTRSETWRRQVNQVLVLGSMLVPFTLGLGFVGSHAKCGCQSGYADGVGDLLLLVFLPAGWVVHAAMPALDVLLHRHERIGVCVGYMHESSIEIVAGTGSGCNHVNKPDVGFPESLEASGEN